MRGLGVLAIAMGACTPGGGEVVLRGVATDGPYSATPLGGGTIQTYDEDGAAWDAADIASSGAFSVRVPAEQEVFVEVAHGDGPVASFSGVSGITAGLKIDTGLFHAVSADELDAWRAQFAGCPGADEPGGVVIGDVMLYGVTDDEGEPVAAATAYARVQRLDGASYTPCYLDPDEGLAYDPESDVTGVAGRFAVFGLDAGAYYLDVGYLQFDEPTSEATWRIRVPEDGVAPRFPMWVELDF